MTALQQIIKEAKVIWKKHPKLSWQEAIKKASTIYKSKHKPKKSGKSIAGKRIVRGSAPKKSAPKKVATKKSTHKDTKSHNVRINVVSGVNPYVINEIQRLTKYNDELQKFIENGKNKLKTDKSLSNFNKGSLKISIGRLQYLLRDNKKRITELKKHIK